MVGRGPDGRHPGRRRGGHRGPAGHAELADARHPPPHGHARTCAGCVACSTSGWSRPSARVFEAEGLTEAVVDRARGVLVEALTGGVALSRPAAIALLEGDGVDPSGRRAYHLVGRFCQEGSALSGPGRGPSADLRAHRRVGAAVVGAGPRGGDGRPRHPLRRQPRTGDRA